MTIVLKNITLRNFLSIGAVTQAVNFDSKELTLILGENLDLGGDGARNGTGKTTLIQGLTYVLFGSPINQIRKDHLINRTNGKGMMVTLEFSSGGIEYKIERGRKPNTLKFYVNNNLQEVTDDAQGENKETQIAIEKAIGMTSDMFKHIVALNTYTQPFLSLPTGDQRKIIEQLLGITLLSEKADIIKDKIRLNKDSIQQEEFKIKAIEEANKRVQEQIENLRRRQVLWQKQHEESLNKLVIKYEELSLIDIENELEAHKELAVWASKKQQQDTYNALLARSAAWQQKHDADVSEAGQAYLRKNFFNIVPELEAWSLLNKWLSDKAEQDLIAVTITAQTKSIEKEKKLIEKLEREVKSLEDHKCYACGQDFHDDQHEKVITAKRTDLSTAVAHLLELEKTLANHQILVKDLGPKPVTHYKTEAEAIRHSSDLANLKKVVEDKEAETNPFNEQLEEMVQIEVGPPPITHYDTEREAIEHKSTVANLENSMSLKLSETDPYGEQIHDMEKKALQEINFDKINELTKFGDHLKFLQDLLTSKDSFVRKKIIDQNLSYLNARLTNYLDKIGLPHTVVFKNDLSVEITELGRELDFDNLSRGERNRLILGLSFSFRDVWENLYYPINTIFIDELIDSGMDTVGVENSMAILKDMSRRRNKSIWLVSHREELAGRVPQVLKVVKEAGFTTYSTTTEID
jgi:DNA repair exonuclease SbcCD ATPase subunit